MPKRPRTISTKNQDGSENTKNFNINSLSETDKKNFAYVGERVWELRQYRKQAQYNVMLEQIWQDADKDYVPHRLNSLGKKVITTDEDKGWRGTNLRFLDNADWRADFSKPNPFTKIQTALSILVDQNPSGVFTPASKQYQATTKLMEQLYSRSWEYARSKQQLKLFVFNLAKYGWAISRTYPLRISRTVRNIVEYNDEDPEKSVYETKEVVEYNDIFRENLDPWNCWIDDMTKPNNRFSMRDWAWRKVYTMDSFMEEFGRYPNSKFVRPGGVTSDRVDAPNSSIMPQRKFVAKDLVEVYFYENRMKDLFCVKAGEVPVVLEPLPVADISGSKKLSCWQAYWNLRSAESPYGIGIYEAIRYEQAVLDSIRNMTIDQLTLSINKMFFYQGTSQLTETGDISITPGKGKQVLDPKNVKWLEVPGPGADAWKGLEVMDMDVEKASGISDTLEGTITGKTAFEVAQAKEAALKRLKTPLDNITDALSDEAYLTISLIQLMYSVPEVHQITDAKLVDEYLNEIQSDPDLYERDTEGNFQAKVYREFPLNLSKDEKGNLVETKETEFFRVKPKSLDWAGVIYVKAQSVLTPSKQVDKALELEMYNILIPLLAQPPEIYQKVAKQICKLYDKDPEDILPDSWLNPMAQMMNGMMPGVGATPGVQGTPQGAPPLFVPTGGATQGTSPPAGGPNGAAQAPTLVSSTQMSPQKPTGVVGKTISRTIGPMNR